MAFDPTDVCAHGHQLAPGSDPITLKTIDPATGRLLKEETLLLRRHVVMGTDGRPMVSEFRPGTAAEADAAWQASIKTTYDNPILTEGAKRALAAAEPPPDDPAWTA